MMQVKITNKEAVLQTAGKFCDENINILVDIPSEGGSGDTLTQFLKGELTEYTNTEVTTIKSYQFYSNKNIDTLNFPNCESVEGYAFRLSTIKNINIPKCKTLGGYVFYDSSLKTLDLPNCETMGTFICYGASLLTSVNMPKVAEVKNSAFSGCSNLKTVNFDSAVSIGAAAFYNSMISTIRLPKVQNITNNAFQYCYSLYDIYLGYEGVVSYGGTARFTRNINLHVRPEYAEQYATATNWSVLIEQGNVTIVGDYDAS